MIWIDPTILLHILHDAGKIGLAYFRKITAVTKPDKSLLTEADLEINQFLTEALQRLFPTHQIFSEEQEQHHFDLHAAFTWVIDPLDGTTAFVNGLHEWGIAIGFMEAVTPQLGFFYMPLLQQITFCSYEDGAFFHSPIFSETASSLDVQTSWTSEGFLAVSSAHAHQAFTIDLKRVRTVGSASTALAYVAQGVATAALLPKARLWDLAACVPIIHQAGGVVCYLSGKPIDYAALVNGRLAPEPVIAAHPKLIPHLQATIHPQQ